MIESILSYIWPENKVERIFGFVLAAFLLAGLTGPFQDEAQAVVGLLYLFVPVVVTALFWLLFCLKLYPKAFETGELLSPLIFYGIVFSSVYYRMGLSEEIILGFIPRLGRFSLLTGGLLCTVPSHFLQIRILGITHVEKEERTKRSLIPRHETMSYFAQTVGEWGVMFMSLFWVGTTIAVYWSDISTIPTVFSVCVFTLLALSPVLLSHHRTEVFFWLVVVLFTLLGFVGAALQAPFLPWIGHELFLFILFGLAVIYRLETAHQHVVLVMVMAVLFIAIPVVIQATNIFEPTLLKTLVTTVAVPLLAAILSAYLAARWTRATPDNSASYLTAGQVAEELGGSLTVVHKMFRDGRIQAQKKRGRWMVNRGDFEKYNRMQPQATEIQE